MKFVVRAMPKRYVLLRLDPHLDSGTANPQLSARVGLAKLADFINTDRALEAVLKPLDEISLPLPPGW